MEMSEISADEDVTRNESAERCEDEEEKPWKVWLKKSHAKIQFQLHYFFFFGALGLIASGAAIIANKEKHISPQAFASILFADQLIITVLKPALGYVADYFRKLKEVILALASIHMFAFPALFSLPPIPEETMNFNTTDLANEGSTHSLWQDYKTWQFWFFAIVFMMMDVTGNSILALSDAACYENVLKTGADFGRHRMWGAIGFGLFAPIAGILNDYYPNYVASYTVFFLLAVFMLINITFMDMPMPQLAVNILKDFKKVLYSKKFLFFDFGILFNGMGMGIIHFFLIWYFLNLGGTQLTCGLLYFTQCVVEIPFMFISGFLIKKIGYMHILSMSYSAYALKFGFYSLLYNSWFLLPVELLHGLAYGLPYTARITRAKACSKEGTEATTQAVVSATYDGIGSGLGSLIGGLAFYYLDAHCTFLYLAIFFSIATVINHIIYMYNCCKKKVYISPCTNETSSTIEITTTSFSTIAL